MEGPNDAERPHPGRRDPRTSRGAGRRAGEGRTGGRRTGVCRTGGWKPGLLVGPLVGALLLAGCSSGAGPPATPAVNAAAPLPPGAMVTVPVPAGAVETPCPDGMPANYTPLRCFKDAAGQWHGGGGMPAATLPPGLPVTLLVPPGAQVVECDTPAPPAGSGAGKVCYISDKGMPGSSAWTT